MALYLIAGVAFSPLLSGQFHLAYAQSNATTISGNMTGNTTTMSGNATGASGGDSVTISPGSHPQAMESFSYLIYPDGFKGNNSFVD